MLLINILDIIGTVAFAISGAFLGIQKKLDIFGVSFLAIVTAVGGGIFRDLIIGTTPPVAFQNPMYCVVSILTAVITFKLYNRIQKLKNIILITDAIGLGVFTAIGANAAICHGFTGWFLIISTGLFTGVGGGILRDVSVQHIPLVFKKEIYAIASIIGALVFYLSYKHLSVQFSTYLCCIITFTVRMISIRYNLNLPVCKEKDEKLKKDKLVVN